MNFIPGTYTNFTSSVPAEMPTYVDVNPPMKTTPPVSDSTVTSGEVSNFIYQNVECPDKQALVGKIKKMIYIYFF